MFCLQQASDSDDWPYQTQNVDFCHGFIPKPKGLTSHNPKNTPNNPVSSHSCHSKHSITVRPPRAPCPSIFLSLYRHIITSRDLSSCVISPRYVMREHFVSKRKFSLIFCFVVALSSLKETPGLARERFLPISVELLWEWVAIPERLPVFFRLQEQTTARGIVGFFGEASLFGFLARTNTSAQEI